VYVETGREVLREIEREREIKRESVGDGDGTQQHKTQNTKHKT
jgi:hypothetical protein